MGEPVEACSLVAGGKFTSTRDALSNLSATAIITAMSSPFGNAQPYSFIARVIYTILSYQHDRRWLVLYSSGGILWHDDQMPPITLAVFFPSTVMIRADSFRCGHL